MTTPNDPTPSLDPVDALIAAYLQAVEAGQVPDRREWLGRHPDHAEALQAFFADFDRMDRVASPLRVEPNPDETQALDVDGRALPPTVRYFGDYELLEEVARGGMGIVYKARQVSLNRPVALKMVLSGTFATPREVARFQAEAEAAANLDHPNIVPVYEVGEHQGQQYFSMKFIEGTSLARHPRGPARDEVRAFLAVVRAVHHAHQRGVLHRDLKPSNILIDPEGSRHVTDFGLAKRLGDLDRSLTEAGQILGTPRYMAPEQAAGRKDLTVAADIYSLGVILYERLTGRPPFLGDNIPTLLHQVREATPPRPTAVHPDLDRDLETITLKCLEKEPTRRYPTAAELTEDLERWLEGRPIQARPVGQAERLTRWCRRNPLVAGLVASVVLAMILGTVVSTLFAWRERNERIRADEANENTEMTLARSLIRPLKPDVLIDGRGDESLSEPEVESLWELAENGGESVRFRFVGEAIRDPLAIRQFGARAEPALIASIGLSSERRERVAHLLAGSIHDPGVTFPKKVELAFLALNLEDQPGPATEASREIIAQIRPGTFPRDIDSWGWHLVSGASRFEKIATCRMLIDGGGWANVFDSVGPWQDIWVGLAGRLGPNEASVVARILSDAFEGENGAAPYGLNELAEASMGLMDRLDSEDVSRIARSLIVATARPMPDQNRQGLIGALAKLTARLDGDESAKICGPIVRSMSDQLSLKRLGEDSRGAVGTIGILSPRIGSSDASYVIAKMVAIARTMKAGDDGDWELLLSSVKAAARLTTNELDHECDFIASALADLIERNLDKEMAVEAIEALTAISARLSVDVARRSRELACKILNGICDGRISVELIVRGDVGGFRSDSGDVGSRLTVAIDKIDAGRNARALADSLARGSGDPNSLAYGLSVLADKLEPEEAPVIIRTLTDALARDISNSPGTVEALAKALIAITGRLGPGETATACRPIALTLLGALRQANWRDRDSLNKALALVSVELRPEDAIQITRGLGGLLKQDPERHGSSATILAKLAARLDPVDASDLARTLFESLERAKAARPDIAACLAVLASRLEGRAASEISHGTIRALLKAHNRDYDSALCGFASEPGLPGLLNQANPEVARRLVRWIVTHVCASGVPAYGSAKYLADLLPDARRTDRNERNFRLASGWDEQASVNGPVRLAIGPHSCRLTTLELVELLKMPTCFGGMRLVVLDQLGHIHGRKFANHWEFVRFAREKGLKFDFTSPPRRPDPKASLEQLLKELPE